MVSVNYFRESVEYARRHTNKSVNLLLCKLQYN